MRLTDEQMIQVRINTAVDEALSANNAKWREVGNSLIKDIEKVGVVTDFLLGAKTYLLMLLSQMEGE